MAGHEDHILNQPTATHSGRRLQGLLSWWWVWLPVIIAVTLWIGGWGFGNYGGPWSPRPRTVQPQISDPGVTGLDSNRPCCPIFAPEPGLGFIRQGSGHFDLQGRLCS
jgi:hypothetical protein